MKRILLITLAAIACLSCNRTEPLSVRIVRSEMARNPHATDLDGQQGRLKWNYTTGLELKAILDVYDRYGNDSLFNYVEAWYDSIIAEDGSISTYKQSAWSTDHICPGKSLFYLYDKTGKEKYRKAMDVLAEQIAGQPRTSEGGFWHKQVYPHQMWLDGLYMAQPFYAIYTSRFAEEKAAAYKDIVNNFLVVAHHTFDAETSLYRHAFDESASMFWCVDEQGRSAHAWGRALGWYCMAIADTMEYIPEETPGRDELLAIFRGIIDTLPRYADKETGMWYQVLDRPGQAGNYVEATASAMFCYAMLKGIRLGYLGSSLESYALETYDRLLAEFVRTDADGLVELQRCCAVAGLGGKNDRRGDYDYYINEKICSNDPKGIGPLIWAALEYESR